jgi:hypothetical protein
MNKVCIREWSLRHRVGVSEGDFVLAYNEFLIHGEISDQCLSLSARDSGTEVLYGEWSLEKGNLCAHLTQIELCVLEMIAPV